MATLIIHKKKNTDSYILIIIFLIMKLKVMVKMVIMVNGLKTSCSKK